MLTIEGSFTHILQHQLESTQSSAQRFSFDCRLLLGFAKPLYSGVVWVERICYTCNWSNTRAMIHVWSAMKRHEGPSRPSNPSSKKTGPSLWASGQENCMNLGAWNLCQAFMTTIIFYGTLAIVYCEQWEIMVAYCGHLWRPFCMHISFIHMSQKYYLEQKLAVFR